MAFKKHKVVTGAEADFFDKLEKKKAAQNMSDAVGELNAFMGW